VRVVRGDERQVTAGAVMWRRHATAAVWSWFSGWTVDGDVDKNVSLCRWHIPLHAVHTPSSFHVTPCPRPSASLQHRLTWQNDVANTRWVAIRRSALYHSVHYHQYHVTVWTNLNSLIQIIGTYPPSVGRGFKSWSRQRCVTHTTLFHHWCGSKNIHIKHGKLN